MANVTTNPSANTTSVSLTSKWTYTYQSGSDGSYTYSTGGASGASGSVTFDLSGIPTGATIKSATLTWTYSTSNATAGLTGYGSTGPGYCSVSVSGHSDNYVYANAQTADFGPYITPGGNCVINFYYKPSIKSTMTSGLQLTSASCSSTLTISNLALSVTYEEPLSACSAPTTVTIAANNVAPGASVTLSWSGAKAGTNNAITAYHIYRSTSSSGTYSHTYTVKSTSTSGSYSVTAPTSNNSTYYYKIYTIGTVSGYNSGESKTVSLTCKFTAPSAPTSVTLSATYVLSGKSATLSWSGAKAGTNNAITKYDIYRDGVFYKTVTSTSQSVPAHSTPGSSYTYTVYTIGTYSNSGASSGVKLYTYSHPSAPTSITLSKVISQGDKVTLSWSGASNGSYNKIAGYKIYVQDSSDGATWNTSTLYADVGLVGSCSVDPPIAGHYRKFTIYVVGERSNSNEKSAPTYLYHFTSGFTDPTIIAGETYIKAIHMTELQNVANILRKCYGLGNGTFTTITSGKTELSGWTSHVSEIKTAMDGTGFSHDTWIAFSVNCPRADVMMQLRNVFLNA